MEKQKGVENPGPFHLMGECPLRLVPAVTRCNCVQQVIVAEPIQYMPYNIEYRTCMRSQIAYVSPFICMQKHAGVSDQVRMWQ